MHELLLFGQVSASRHEQVLKILAGLTAMQPERVVEYHHILKPTAQPQQVVHVGGSQNLESQKPGAQKMQNRELIYLQLVEALKNGQATRTWPSTETDSQLDTAWSLQYYDLPDAAKRTVNMRMASSVEINEGDPRAYVQALGYSHVNSYLQEGHRFVSNNIVILLYRILRLPPGVQAPNDLVGLVGSYNTMMSVDETGGYVLHASIRLQDRNKPDLITKGTAELDAFKKSMKGVVNLRDADRLSMDTRVKG